MLHEFNMAILNQAHFLADRSLLWFAEETVTEGS